jgi:hypothetical protein
MDFGAAVGRKYLAMRWLDGIAHDGVVQGAHDSFRVNVSGSDTTYTVHDNTVGHGENWYDLCVLDVGDIKGVHTVRLCATGMEWAGFNTYGQVAFSEMATKVACEDCDLLPMLMKSTVRLLGVEGPVTRCIQFTPEDGFGLGTPVDVDVLFTGTPATGTVTFEAEEGNWTLLTAKDQQHVLSASSALSLVNNTYYSDINLDMRGGDSDNNDLVDIDDVTWLIATWGDVADGGTHPWDGTRDADFSNDGVIFTEDYAFISENWLEMGDFRASRSGRAGQVLGGMFRPSVREVKTSVTVDKLSGWVADRADLNRDGIVDVQDVRAFEQLHDLGSSLSSKIERTMSKKSVRSLDR